MAASWKHLWQIAARAVSLPSTSRAACVLLHTILDINLVLYHTVSDDVNSIVTAADVNGPALLVDSSIILMLHLLSLRNVKLPNASQSTSHHIIRWVFLKWNPGTRLQAKKEPPTNLTANSRPKLCLPLLNSCPSAGTCQSDSGMLRRKTSASHNARGCFGWANLPKLECPKSDVGSNEILTALGRANFKSKSHDKLQPSDPVLRFYRSKRFGHFSCFEETSVGTFVSKDRGVAGTLRVMEQERARRRHANIA